jgi:hypothetical protein
MFIVQGKRRKHNLIACIRKDLFLKINLNSFKRNVTSNNNNAHQGDSKGENLYVGFSFTFTTLKRKLCLCHMELRFAGDGL